ncbi:hypothetical protein MLD38_029028 [Melastoma candidum]|uniref:Uncharacterized protein n=1 Tax=Melastoma candidum TaxID=119954 RepID=A0ACB9N2I8_9MYRT|nr:hypothetical protein MLD38_029028 [Melastoma candidum]
MDTESPPDFSRMAPTLHDLSVDNDANSSSSSSSPSTSPVYSPFSDCNSDSFGSFSSPNNTHLLLVSCASDELIISLISDLDPSRPLDLRRRAALELRLLTKNKPDIHSRIARAGAIKPLVSLISSSDPQLPLVRALRSGTATARENEACALLRLSQVEENKVAIDRGVQSSRWWSSWRRAPPEERRTRPPRSTSYVRSRRTRLTAGGATGADVTADAVDSLQCDGGSAGGGLLPRLRLLAGTVEVLAEGCCPG